MASPAELIAGARALPAGRGLGPRTRVGLRVWDGEEPGSYDLEQQVASYLLTARE